jgi:hypothetical protein
MTDTGFPALDGKEHLKIHLDAENDARDWGVREIVTHPKATLEGLNPPVIQIEFMGEEEPNMLGLGSPVQIEHIVAYRIWYFSERFSAKSSFDATILVLSKIRKFLIQHPIPDNYGHLFLSMGDNLKMRGFNIVIGAIGGGTETFSGGYIDIYLQKLLTY